eukprot:s2317_g6.t1
MSEELESYLGDYLGYGSTEIRAFFEEHKNEAGAVDLAGLKKGAVRFGEIWGVFKPQHVLFSSVVFNWSVWSWPSLLWHTAIVAVVCMRKLHTFP